MRFPPLFPTPNPRTRRRRSRRPPRPRTALRFTPYAWAKLRFLRDRGRTEVGGFGVSAEADPLLIEDFRLVRQACTAATVRFDDAAVADHFDAGVDEGLRPERFARVWVHTHPGHCPRPSPTDERTFARTFGGCDWVVMAILACGGRSYARLRFAAGPGGDLVLPVGVDFAAPFAAADPAAWAEEYDRCVSDESDSLIDGFCNDGCGFDGFAAASGGPLALFRPSGGEARAAPADPFHDLPMSDAPRWEFHDEYER